MKILSSRRHCGMFILNVSSLLATTRRVYTKLPYNKTSTPYRNALHCYRTPSGFQAFRAPLFVQKHGGTNFKKKRSHVITIKLSYKYVSVRHCEVLVVCRQRHLKQSYHWFKLYRLVSVFIKFSRADFPSSMSQKMSISWNVCGNFQIFWIYEAVPKLIQLYWCKW